MWYTNKKKPIKMSTKNKANIAKLICKIVLKATIRFKSKLQKTQQPSIQTKNKIKLINQKIL